MEDKQIIELLFARDELGLKMTEEKYNKLYRSILRQALQDPADIDECANDVLMGVWNSIPPHYPNHFPSYICRIARRIGINRFKHNTRQKKKRWLPCSAIGAGRLHQRTGQAGTTAGGYRVSGTAEQIFA